MLAAFTPLALCGSFRSKSKNRGWLCATSAVCHPVTVTRHTTHNRWGPCHTENFEESAARRMHGWWKKATLSFIAPGRPRFDRRLPFRRRVASPWHRACRRQTVAGTCSRRGSAVGKTRAAEGKTAAGEIINGSDVGAIGAVTSSAEALCDIVSVGTLLT